MVVLFLWINVKCPQHNGFGYFKLNWLTDDKILNSMDCQTQLEIIFYLLKIMGEQVPYKRASDMQFHIRWSDTMSSCTLRFVKHQWVENKVTNFLSRSIKLGSAFNLCDKILALYHL